MHAAGRLPRGGALEDCWSATRQHQGTPTGSGRGGGLLKRVWPAGTRATLGEHVKPDRSSRRNCEWDTFVTSVHAAWPRG